MSRDKFSTSGSSRGKFRPVPQWSDNPHPQLDLSRDKPGALPPGGGVPNLTTA